MKIFCTTALLSVAILANTYANDIILDNNSAEINGNWNSSTYEINFFGEDYYYLTKGNVTSNLTWRPNIVDAGRYRVFYRLPDGSATRASNAEIVISHTTSTSLHVIDQTAEQGGRWKLLGTYEFNTGNSGFIQISGSNNGIVIADAIKLVPEDSIVDDSDSLASAGWKTSSYENNFFGEGYSYVEGEMSGEETIEYRPFIPATGDYDVYYNLPDGNNTRAKDANITIHHAFGESTYEVDQTVQMGGQWVLLGTHQLAGGSSNTVELFNTTSDNYVVADAFKFKLGNAPVESFNVALGAIVSADSHYLDYSPYYAIDGVSSTSSRWLSESTSSDHWLELDLRKSYGIQCAVIENGYEDTSGITNFSLQYFNGLNWEVVPGTSVIGNENPYLILNFTEVAEGQKFRIYSTGNDQVKIKEVKLYTNYGNCPEQEPIDFESVIYINQSGYNLDEPKRFTAPTLDSSAPFSIARVSDDAIVFSSTLENNIGDFSTFNPIAKNEEYYITSGTQRSYNFSIGYYWNEKVSYQNSVDFMTSARCYFGSDSSCTKGFAWRDSHQFSFELQSLIAQYFSNPSAYNRMPIKVNYQTSLNGTDYGTPGIGHPHENAPDIVKMIHWGVNRYIEEEVNHPLFKEQLAYFLHAYPDLSDYISENDYQQALSYLNESMWENPSRSQKGWYDSTVPSFDGNLFQAYTVFGNGKGAFPPGHSIMPNLLMYEVSVRENWNLVLQQRFLDAAYNQTAEIISNVDWQDPSTTKGQRMSEHITMEGLAFYQREHPNLAPPGLQSKINQWADIVIARSNNLWDFRKYGDGPDDWVIPGFNEPGNVAGLPAAIYSAIQVLDDDAKNSRLREIATAHLDNMFGRNPTGRHFSYKNTQWQGVEKGWYSQHNGYGKLNSAIAVIDGSAKAEHYPYNPGAGDVGWTEGWIAFNSAWNSSLAYSAFDKTKIKYYDQNFSTENESFSLGDNFGIELIAPLNFNYDEVEFGEVVVTTSSGDKEVLSAFEVTKNSNNFRIVVNTDTAPTSIGDGKLQLLPNDDIKISYGLGYLERQIDLQGSSGSYSLVNNL